MQITINENKISEYDIKKSRFISYAFFVPDETFVTQTLADLRKQHKDARHICYAYVYNNLEKCSDDGEPSGTAGKPLLDLIKNNGFTNLFLVVVRYFGGIKLGAGGLYRAYLTSGKQVLEECEKVELVNKLQVEIKLPYELEGEVLTKIKQCKITQLKVQYLEQIKLTFVVDNLTILEDVKHILKSYNIIFTYENILIRGE